MKWKTETTNEEKYEKKAFAHFNSFSRRNVVASFTLICMQLNGLHVVERHSKISNPLNKEKRKSHQWISTLKTGKKKHLKNENWMHGIPTPSPEPWTMKAMAMPMQTYKMNSSPSANQCDWWISLHAWKFVIFALRTWKHSEIWPIQTSLKKNVQIKCTAMYSRSETIIIIIISISPHFFSGRSGT